MLKQEIEPLVIKSAAYKLLASIFNYPDQFVYNAMNSGFYRETLENLTQYMIESGTVTAELSSTWLYKGEEFWQKPLEGIQAAYTELFDFSYPQPVCPPYAGMYMPGGNNYPGPRTQLMGELGTKYYCWGLELENEVNDHIAVELEFMHFLLATQYIAAEQNKDSTVEKLIDEQKWLTTHMKEWIPEFAESLTKQSPDSIWAIAADILLNLLK